MVPVVGPGLMRRLSETPAKPFGSATLNARPSQRLIDSDIDLAGQHDRVGFCLWRSDPTERRFCGLLEFPQFQLRMNLVCDLSSALPFCARPAAFADNFLYGETRRKNALPFRVLMGMETWFVASEPETFTQFVPSPSSSELVCICNHQPVWSAGQPT